MAAGAYLVYQVMTGRISSSAAADIGILSGLLMIGIPALGALIWVAITWPVAGVALFALLLSVSVAMGTHQGR